MRRAIVVGGTATIHPFKNLASLAKTLLLSMLHFIRILTSLSVIIMTQGWMSPRIPLLHNRKLSVAVSGEAWWKEGLNFKCTGCGRCCMNEGEVWLDADEFDELCYALDIPHATAIDQYVEQVQSNWVKLKSKESTDAATSGQCIFLDEDGKKCTIYEQRPAQCRSYPYWPRLLANPDAYNDEGVFPDGEGGPEAKHWTPEKGGCEGINNKNNETIVPARTIYRNLQLYNAYTSSFPFMSNGDDRNRLISSAEVIRAVTKSTRAWVNNFVVKYDLCPFARSVFESNRVRYRVFLGTDLARLRHRLRYEMLHLLTVPENEVATTLIVLPFALTQFTEFNEFMVQYEDVEMKEILKEMRGPDEESQSKSRLLSRAKAKSQEETKEIQLASFHPAFQWADTDFDAPLNFEKRAPFPVINLLRAARVREYASEESTKRIAGYNVKSLEAAGPDVLREEMENIIKIALS